MNRRTFARTVAAVLAGLGLSRRAGAAAGPDDREPTHSGAGALPPSSLPTRRLGRTGLDVPILALGGHHLGLAGSERQARALVETALEEGIRFFDNAESYHGGRSERWLGAALSGVRADVLVMTKTYSPRDRSADSARRHLEGSLERLGMDYLDLWQLHSIRSVADVELAFRPGGAMEYILRARDEGLVRYVGVTGHVTPAAHRRALRYWDEGWRFDTLQFPINPIDYHQRSYQRQILVDIVARDIGVIAMKTSADGRLLRERICSIDETLRYVWSLPVNVAVVGMERPELVRENARIARNFDPMSPEDLGALRDRIEPRADLSLEWYKT
jgi:predicted aldo/keto reductase-like oxidoreductase